MDKINFRAVRKEFFNLLFKNRRTTSLEVKMALRNKGYFATQNEVSSYMSNIKEDEYIPFTVNDNGKYKVYELSDNVDDFVEGLIINFFKHFGI